MSFAGFLSADLVDLYVGSSRKHWRVHKAVLCSKSDYVSGTSFFSGGSYSQSSLDNMQVEPSLVLLLTLRRLCSSGGCSTTNFERPENKLLRFLLSSLRFSPCFWNGPIATLSKMPPTPLKSPSLSSLSTYTATQTKSACPT